MLSRLIPILLFPGCTSSYDHTREVAHLVHQSAEAVNASSEIVYNRIKENAYQYPDRGTPLLNKANAIESRITELNASLESYSQALLKPTRSALLETYDTAVEDISCILDIASYNLPPQYKFRIDTSAVSLDSLSTAFLPHAIRLNLALIKSDVLQLLSVLAPQSIGCYFGNKIAVVDEKEDDRTIHIDLSCRTFSLAEKRYITIDSSTRNGKPENLDFILIPQYTFARISMDSLLPGAYKLYGKASAFPGGYEITEPFSHEFNISAN